MRQSYKKVVLLCLITFGLVALPFYCQAGIRRFVLKRMLPKQPSPLWAELLPELIKKIPSFSSDSEEDPKNEQFAELDLAPLETKLNSLTSARGALAKKLNDSPSPFIKLQPLPAPGESSTPPKGGVGEFESKDALALCIGVVSRHPSVDSGKPVRGAQNDAEAMAAMLEFSGFPKQNVHLLLNNQATHRNVIGAIKEAAKIVPNNGLFVITYSGHGTFRADKNNDEKETITGDRFDEAWCLFDKILLDDELPPLWAEFKPGVRILVMLDSCFSGTATKAPGEDLEDARELAKALIKSEHEEAPVDKKPEEINAEIEELAKQLAPRLLSAEDQKKDEAINGKAYDSIASKAPDNTTSGGQIVILMAACQDTQKAWGGTYGVFTRSLQRVVRSSSSYQELFDKLKNIVPPSVQTPNLFLLPEGVQSTPRGQEILLRQKPFALK